MAHWCSTRASGAAAMRELRADAPLPQWSWTRTSAGAHRCDRYARCTCVMRTLHAYMDTCTQCTEVSYVWSSTGMLAATESNSVAQAPARPPASRRQVPVGVHHGPAGNQPLRGRPGRRDGPGVRLLWLGSRLKANAACFRDNNSVSHVPCSLNRVKCGMHSGPIPDTHDAQLQEDAAGAGTGVDGAEAGTKQPACRQQGRHRGTIEPVQELGRRSQEVAGHRAPEGVHGFGAWCHCLQNGMHASAVARP